MLRATAHLWTLTRLDAFGTRPYFEFALIAKSLGGDLTRDVSRDLGYSYDAETLPDSFADDRVSFDLRVGIPLRTTDFSGACGAIGEFAAQPESGTWTVHAQTEDRIALSFEALDDEVRGCATVRPVEVRRE